MRGHNNIFSADPPKGDAERHFPLHSSRREFMGSVLLAGAGAMLSSSPLIAKRLIAQSAPAVGAAKAGRMDVHYHLTPPSLIQAFGAQRFANAASNWTLDQRLMDMERNGVATVLCSIAPQGDPFADPSKTVQ